MVKGKSLLFFLALPRRTSRFARVDIDPSFRTRITNGLACEAGDGVRKVRSFNRVIAIETSCKVAVALNSY